MKADELIRQYIEEDPHLPGAGTARIVGTGVRVGIVISYLRGVGWDADQAASAYAIPRDAVEAAHAYYHCHEARINAWILANLAGASIAGTSRLRSTLTKTSRRVLRRA